MTHLVEIHLQQLAESLVALNLWQSQPPHPSKLASTAPFALDTLEPHEWLQWIFIPRMRALLAAKADLPRNFAISPYIEEAMKETDQLARILTPLYALERILNDSHD
ncbi:YqcC family protein [Pasteurellaceae bacterium HPA106]|uniref:YqcC family protein n=1 Tax=Spirabiliibacterium pneumoniae TaxID=221400 RepID=UPI001AAC4951|nr:YqcC family protein [Spirabiliibacterium pneumoniae]MBE2896556.1 YqcC family protein [Spirabiliibacterium pneumoniae]